MKKILCLILACLCTFTFVACEHNQAQVNRPSAGGQTPGGSGGSSGGDSADGKTETPVYRETFIRFEYGKQRNAALGTGTL